MLRENRTPYCAQICFLLLFLCAWTLYSTGWHINTKKMHTITEDRVDRVYCRTDIKGGLVRIEKEQWKTLVLGNLNPSPTWEERAYQNFPARVFHNSGPLWVCQYNPDKSSTLANPDRTIARILPRASRIISNCQTNRTQPHPMFGQHQIFGNLSKGLFDEFDSRSANI